MTVLTQLRPLLFNIFLLAGLLQGRNCLAVLPLDADELSQINRFQQLVISETSVGSLIEHLKEGLSLFRLFRNQKKDVTQLHRSINLAATRLSHHAHPFQSDTFNPAVIELESNHLALTQEAKLILQSINKIHRWCMQLLKFIKKPTSSEGDTVPDQEESLISDSIAQITSSWTSLLQTPFISATRNHKRPATPVPNDEQVSKRIRNIPVVQAQNPRIQCSAKQLMEGLESCTLLTKCELSDLDDALSGMTAEEAYLLLKPYEKLGPSLSLRLAHYAMKLEKMDEASVHLFLGDRSREPVRYRKLLSEFKTQHLRKQVNSARAGHQTETTSDTPGISLGSTFFHEEPAIPANSYTAAFSPLNSIFERAQYETNPITLAELFTMEQIILQLSPSKALQALGAMNGKSFSADETTPLYFQLAREAAELGMLGLGLTYLSNFPDTAYQISRGNLSHLIRIYQQAGTDLTVPISASLRLRSAFRDLESGVTETKLKHIDEILGSMPFCLSYIFLKSKNFRSVQSHVDLILADLWSKNQNGEEKAREYLARSPRNMTDYEMNKALLVRSRLERTIPPLDARIRDESDRAQNY